MKDREKRALLFGLLLLAVLAADLPVLQAGFAFDDLHSIARNPHLRTLANIPRFFVDPTCFSGIPRNAMYRPFLLVTYALDYAVAGLSPWFWHLTNLLLHWGTGILVFFSCSGFSRGARKAGKPGRIPGGNGPPGSGPFSSWSTP